MRWLLQMDFPKIFERLKEVRCLLDQNSLKSVVVACSGTGRSLMNLWEKSEDHGYRISGVICSRFDCPAYLWASDKKIPVYCAYFPLESYQEQDLLEWLTFLKADLIVLAGFLRKFPNLSVYEKRIINIHPALLPKFGGKGMHGRRVHEAVIAAGEHESGATVHFVNSEYDKGEVIEQVRLKVVKAWSADELAAAVFNLEKTLLPAVISRLLNKIKEV